MTNFGLGLTPFGSAQIVNVRGGTVRSDVAGDAISLVDRYIEYIAVLVLNCQVFALISIDSGFVQTDELTYTVVNMHNKITRLEIGKDRFGGFAAQRRSTAWLRSTPAENLTVCQEMMTGFLVKV